MKDYKKYLYSSLFFVAAGVLSPLVPVASASSSSGTILSTTYSTALVCQDAACTPSLGHRINFKPTIGTGVIPVTIDDTTGVSGMIWGEQLGWINLKPTNYGLSINPATGKISGLAWSQVGGWINFSPTNYGVSIDNSGQFAGYAWASGANGGWIKFDCSGGATTTCVKTDWLPTGARTVVPSGGGGGGGGGGFVIPPTTSTTTPTININNSTSSNYQTGPQGQRDVDYANDYRSDINDSGWVDIFDFNLLLVNWSKEVTIDLSLPKKDRCKKANIADINCNGKVDIFDFNLLLINWGKKIGNK